MAPKLSPADFLRSRPQGAQHWLDTFGSSMAPFLRSGDALLVERGAQVTRGDIAVLARADGALLAHLVTCAAPLRTSTLLGFEDAAGLTLLGRAVRVRSHGRELGVGPALRQSLLAAHAVLSVGRARTTVQRVLSAPGLRALRRHALEPDVRLLDAGDLAAALRATGDLGARIPPDLLRIAFRRGVVAGVVAHDRVLSLAFIVPAHGETVGQLSMTGMLPLGRGLDLEPRLLAFTLAEAAARFFTRVEAALFPLDAAPTLRAAGFANAPGGGLALDLG